MAKMNNANELAGKFVAKQRVIKETSSIGGFRISKDKLKKREDKKLNNANESLGIFPFNPNEENYPDNRDHSNYYPTNFTSNSKWRKTSGNYIDSASLSKPSISNF